MRKALVAAVVGVLALAAASIALATGTQQTYKESFAATKGGKPSSTSFTVNATDPTNGANQNQPNPAREIDLTFPAGTLVDSTALPQCKATDTDFSTKGSGACSSKTKIGSGSATANTGFPPPITTIPVTVTAFNGKNQLILYVVPQGGASNPFVIRALLKGSKTHRKLVTKVPPNCIPPGKPADSPPCGGKEAPIADFQLSTLKKTSGKGSKRKSFITTPKCPKSKKWTFTAKFTYRDDPPKTLTSTQACK